MEAAPIEIRPVSDYSEWEMAKAIRQEVFIEEQKCPPEEEWDVYDEVSRHLIGFVAGQPIATARWRTAPYDGRAAAKLERFAILQPYRGRGYGRTLVRHVMDDARRAGFHTLILHAQAHLEEFYTSLGFTTVSKEWFMEAGIPHVLMVYHDVQVN